MRDITRTMAYVTKPGKVEFQATALAPLADDEVQVQVRAASICGSDLHIFKGKHPAVMLPVAVGHELAGEVVQVGKAVTRINVGDRVAVEPSVTCGECVFCQRGEYNLCTTISFQYREGQGSFTQDFVVDETKAHRLPDSLTFEEGALIEPLSVAIHAVKRSGLQFGQTCAIVGDGSIGLLITMVCKTAGASDIYVVGSRAYKLEKALEIGASDAFSYRKTDAQAKISTRTDGLGVDIAFEAVGLESTLVQSLQVTKKGGVVVVAGLFEEPTIRIPSNIFVQREITLVGTQGYNWDFQTAIELVGSGQIDLKKIISHTLPLPDLQRGFDMQFDPANETIKIVMQVD